MGITFVRSGASIIERQAVLNALFKPGENWLHVLSGRRYRVRYVDVHGYVVLDPLHDDHLHTNVPYFLHPKEVGPSEWQLWRE